MVGALILLAALIETGAVLVGVVSSASRMNATPWAPLLLLHGAAVIACLVAWQRLNRHEAAARDAAAPDHAASTIRHASTWRLAALGIAALGPLGVIGTAFAWALQRAFAARGAALDPSWLRAIGPGDADATDQLKEQHKIDAALVQRPSVSPFNDVMSHGSPSQKQDVVAAIGANFKPPFARTLKRALRDSEASVRMIAAATAARIENALHDSSIGLESEWADNPGDSRRALALAQHYDDHANTDLLDAERAAQTRERALEMYVMAREQHLDDTLIDHAVIRLLVKLNRDDEAIETFRAAMDSGAATPILTSWYLEALFRRRQYAALRHYSEPLLEREKNTLMLDDRSLQAAHLWAKGTSTGATGLVTLGLTDVVDGEAAPPVRRVTRRLIDVPYFTPRTF